MLLSQNLRKGGDFVKLALKVMLWKRFGEAWRSLGGVPEGSWTRFWGSREVLGGLLVSRCRFVKKCEVFDPKLGSMLGHFWNQVAQFFRFVQVSILDLNLASS